MMRDFKEKNHHLIMLRPSKEILRSVQSLSEETIRVVNTDVELGAILKELNTSERTQAIGMEVTDISNGKATGSSSTKL